MIGPGSEARLKHPWPITDRQADARPKGTFPEQPGSSELQLPISLEQAERRTLGPMNLWESLRVLRRRWPILATVAVLTVGSIAVALQGVPPTYESRTTLLLVMPAKADGTAAAINPYLNFGSTLIVTGKVLAEAMAQDSMVQSLKKTGAKAAYAIVPDPWGQSPTLTVIASDPDQKQVATTLQQLVEATRRELANRQKTAGAPAASWIAAVDVTSPEKPKILRGGQLRAIVLIGGLGTALALLLAFAAEGWQRRRVVQWADDARDSIVEIESGLLSRGI
jgi:capsular polysaccharide biosynthesis protein